MQSAVPPTLESQPLSSPEPRPTESAKADDRIHPLDGLRAVAALMVLLAHFFTNNLPWPELLQPFGVQVNNFFSSGVELFFILSGLIMLRPYLNGRRMKAIEYFKRRWIRLWPPFLVSWLLCGVATYLGTAMQSPYAKEALQEFNVWRWLSQVLVVTSSSDRYNVTWWSLNVEFFFYALVPLFLVLGIARWSLQGFWVAFAVAVMISFAAYYPRSDFLFWRATPLEVGLLFLWYSPCFLLGIGIAQFRLSNPHLARGLIFAGAAIVVAAAFYSKINFHTGYGFFFGGVAMLALQDTAISRFLSRRGMIWLGERSYSIFLIHVPVLYLVSIFATALTQDKMSLTYIGITRVIGIPLSIFCSMLVFHYVERRYARNLATGDQFWPWSPAGKPSPEQRLEKVAVGG